MAFVEGRQIVDASLMANELIDEWKWEKKKVLAIKLDMEKALLQKALDKNVGNGKNGSKFAISSTNFSIIINC